MKTKRWLLALMVSMIAIGATPAHADRNQVEHGMVLVPVPTRVGSVLVDRCGGVTDSLLWWASGDEVRGYRFAIQARTRGMPFALTSGQPAADLDISFRTAAGRVRFHRHSFGGEHGVVPARAIEALVCLSGGAPTQFTYVAGPAAGV